LYSCMKMEEMRYVEAIPEMGGREDKGEWWGYEFSYDVL
jgi:hypothetical protein